MWLAFVGAATTDLKLDELVPAMGEALGWDAGRRADEVAGLRGRLAEELSFKKA